VEFTVADKILGLLGDFTVPRESVSEVTVHDDPLAAIRGFRAPGLSIPGRRKIGIWRARSYRDAVVVTADMPAIRLCFEGQRYDALLISSPQAARWASSLLEHRDESEHG